MLSQVQTQNLGKLVDATVRVGPLTVLAGVNSTGKTFFSKMLYSVIHAMLSDHVGTVLTPVLREAMEYLSSEMDKHFPERKGKQDEAFQLARSELAESLSFEKKAGGIIVPLGYGAASVFSNDNAGPRLEFVEAASRLDAAFAEFKALAQQRMKGENETSSGQAAKFLAQAEERVKRLRGVLMMSGDDFVSAGISIGVREETLKNFQVEKPGDLRADSDKEIRFDIMGEANFYFTDRAGGHIASERASRELRRHSRAIYLDSPAFWRAKIGLENARRFRRNEEMKSNGRNLMDGIPKYFYDLDEMLDRALTGDVPFPQVVERIADVIGGKVVRDAFGHMEFVEGGKRFPLSSTAMGAANLGILALLIEKKLVDKRTFLFIDEPEANLHPAWQVEMVRALFSLAQGGVNVVLATHSVDIVKYLDVHLQEHPELKGLVELNHFTREGVVGGDKDFGERMDDIMLDLTDPFHKLRLDEIRASWSPS